MTKAGYKRFDFVAKQSPHKIADPKTEKGKQQIQAEIDALGEIFVRTVAANRNVSVAKVLSDFGGGGVVVGREAVKVGLCDSVASLSELLAGLNEAAGTRKSRPAPSPARKSQSAAIAAQPTAQDIHMNALMEEIEASGELKHRFTKAANSRPIADGRVKVDQFRIQPGITARALIEKIEEAVAVADAPALFAGTLPGRRPRRFRVERRSRMTRQSLRPRTVELTTRGFLKSEPLSRNPCTIHLERLDPWPIPSFTRLPTTRNSCPIRSLGPCAW